MPYRAEEAAGVSAAVARCGYLIRYIICYLISYRSYLIRYIICYLISYRICYSTSAATLTDVATLTDMA